MSDKDKCFPNGLFGTRMDEGKLWVSLNDYESLEADYVKLEAENKRLMALVNSHTEDS